MQIKKLTLKTLNLSAQLNFYTNILGCTISNKKEQEFSIELGTSQLTFIQDSNFTPYHFAINIPNNQAKEALGWLKERVEILKDGIEEIPYFDFWDAEAVYFYDADRNIVEFTARKNLSNDSKEKFGIKSFLEIGEIGVPSENIECVFNAIHKVVELPIDIGDFNRFCALGDQQGLFICIDKRKKEHWFPTEDKALVSDFTLSMEEQGNTFEVTYKAGEMEVIMQ